MFFLNTCSESSIWSGELHEESDVRLTNLKESVGLILIKSLSFGLLFPSICLRGLSYLYLGFLTLVEGLSS
jgi:hypothetical protein